MHFEIPFYDHSLRILGTPRGVNEIEFQPQKPSSSRAPRSPLERKIAAQISVYLSGKSKNLGLRIDWETLKGTAFQKKVWKKMSKIPFGKVLTYGEIASRLSSKGAARAVGTACSKNPVLLAIPCHRVVSKTGLGGFSGGGIEVKRKLLEIEGGPSELS